LTPYLQSFSVDKREKGNMKKRYLPLSILSILAAVMLSFEAGNVLAEGGDSAAAEAEKSEGLLDKMKGSVGGGDASKATAEAASEATEAAKSTGEGAVEESTDKAKSMIKGE
jgi:hypothetical protein